MAHFLSEATHQRLELRDVPDDVASEDQAYSTGVVKTHIFQSAMRCMAVVDNCHSDDANGLQRYTDNTPFSLTMRRSLRQGALDVTEGAEMPLDAMPRLQVWSGDTIGTVTGRMGLTGVPQHVLSQSRGRGVYAYAIHHHEPYVWVGFSDGFLHVFQSTTGLKVCEMRAHTAAINAITTVGNYVFTAGSDWQIIQWDPLELKRIPHGQLSGHQNAVRCLVGTTADSSASGVLYSGGDDFVVRCWDLDTGYERADPWPIIGHTGSVRAVAVHGVYLFSGSADGQVRAWNTQTAQLVRVLDDRGMSVSIGALSLDAASPAVWAGGTDGVIRMWNAQTLSLIGERNDHHATHVALIAAVARANAIKAWVLDSTGALITVFSDPDGACSTTGHGGYKALQPLEQDLQRQVDGHRVKILQNYAELERCRDEFDEMQAVERDNKMKHAKAAGSQRSRLLATTFLHQSSRFVSRRRANASLVLRSAMFGSHAERSLVQRYMSKWRCFVSTTLDRKQEKLLLQSLKAMRNRALAVRYAGLLADVATRTSHRTVRDACARAFANANGHLLLRNYYALWRRQSLARKLSKQRVPFIRASQSLASTALESAYWNKLRNAVVADRAAAALQLTCDKLQHAAPANILRAYWTKWLQAKSVRKSAIIRQASARALLLTQDRETAQLYFSTWITNMRARTMQNAKMRLDAESQDLHEVRAQVQESEGINEEALELTLAAKQRELAELRQQEHVWESRLRRAVDCKRRLQREALRSPAIDSSEPLANQLSQAIYLIKARGVNLKHNEEDILQARQAVAESDASTVFAQGIGMVRKVCAAVVRPAPLTDPGDLCWFIGALFSKITERQVLKAAQGLARMVTAYDMANMKQLGSQWLTPTGDAWALPQFAEAIENLGTLLELALRAYRVRRGEDMETGGPKSVHRIRKPSKSRSRSKRRSKSKATTRNTSTAKKATT